MKNSTRKGRKHPANLREQVDDEVMAFWRTPDAHCGRGAKSLETLKKKMDDGMPISLNDQAKHSGFWITPAATESIRTKFDRKHIMKSFNGGHINITSQAYSTWKSDDGHLNPQWVEQLMGFPEGWTEV